MNASGSAVSEFHSSRPTWVRWQVVALLVGYSFMTWFNRISLPVAYDEAIQKQTGITAQDIGVAYSAFFWAYTICMTPGGWFADRFGPRAALVMMGLGSGLFVGLMGLAGLPSFVAAGMVLPILLIVRPLTGVFTAPIYPSASRLVAHWIPWRQRAWANGLIQAGAAVGIASAFLVFGALVDWFDWQTAFAINGGVTILLALLLRFRATDYPNEHPSVNKAEEQIIGHGTFVGERPRLAPPSQGGETRGSWLALLGNRSLILLTLSYAAVGYFEYLFFHWVHYYFETVLSLGKWESRVYAAVIHLALGAGMILGGWLPGRLHRTIGARWGRTLVPMGGMFCAALFLGIALVLPQTEGIVIWLALALAGVGACEATVWTTAVELGGRLGATAAGICNTGGNVGGLLAPWLTPLLSTQAVTLLGVSEQTGWQYSIAVGSLVCLLGAVLWLWITPNEAATES